LKSYLHDKVEIACRLYSKIVQKIIVLYNSVKIGGIFSLQSMYSDNFYHPEYLL